MSIILPEEYRDPGFQRRIAELKRAEEIGGRNDVWHGLLQVPWVTDKLFAPQHESHCPLGHVDAHLIGDPPVHHQGRECRKRQCQQCSSTWLEPVA